MKHERGGRRGHSGRNHPRAAAGRPKPPQSAGPLGLRPLGDNRYELIHPECIDERHDDYLEAMEAWKLGELEDAREILRFALDGCGDNLWIHVALGRMALESDGDVNLARGHFGYALDLGMRAVRTKAPVILPRDLPANEPIYDAIEGLIAVHTKNKRTREAGELRGLRARLEGRGDNRDPARR